MKNTFLIKVLDPKAFGLLQDMEKHSLIKILKSDDNHSEIKRSEKYRGVFTKEDAWSFNKHT